MSIHTVRVDRSNRDVLLGRLKTDKVVCMGWGGGQGGTLDVFSPQYGENFRNTYPGTSSRIMNNIQNNIKVLKEGDVLLVPNLPGDGNVVVGVVGEKTYSYEADDPAHLNHRIHLKEIYGLDGNISMQTTHLIPWYGKLRNMRLPLYPNYYFDEPVADLLGELRSDPGRQFPASSLDEFFNKTFAHLINELTGKLNGISPNRSGVNFEEVCKRILEAHEYTINGGNLFDGNGGDIDIICSRNKKDVSPFESGEITLYVQVKKHQGVTDEEAVKQLVRYLEKKQNANTFGCVMSLSKEFSATAIEMAENQDIVLIDGDTICRMLMGILASAGELP